MFSSTTNAPGRSPGPGPPSDPSAWGSRQFAQSLGTAESLGDQDDELEEGEAPPEDSGEDDAIKRMKEAALKSIGKKGNK